MTIINEFLDNYGTLHDAVIQSIALTHAANPINTRITMQLECMSIKNDNEWVNLTVDFYEIEEFKIFSNEPHSLSVVNNFCFSFIEDKFVFDFIPHVLYPKNIKEHRDSLFYIAFKAIDFKEDLIE